MKGIVATGVIVAGTFFLPSCNSSEGDSGADRGKPPQNCAADSCAHGQCVSLATGFSCSCDLGFEGTRCDSEIEDLVDHCDNQPCGDYGVCQNQNVGHTCTCVAGWAGEDCDEESDELPCDVRPCGDGGAQCQNLPDGKFACTCLPDFFGEQCQVEGENPCVDSSCQNGSCNATEDGASCSCFAGWDGEQCDEQVGLSNPILHINDCAIELVAPYGWEDNDDGTFSTKMGLVLNNGRQRLEIPGLGIVYDEDERSFEGEIAGLPTLSEGFLAGALMAFSPTPDVHVGVRTGEEVKENLADDFPLPDDLELLAFELSAAGFTLSLPSVPDAADQTELSRSSDTAIAFFLDPCDPLAYLTMSGDSLKPSAGINIDGVLESDGSYSEAAGFGFSLGGNLLAESSVQLWDGENTEDFSLGGQLYVAGNLPLSLIAKIPVSTSGDMIVDVDPHRDGALGAAMINALFLDGDLLGASEGVAETAVDLALLGDVNVALDLPLPPLVQDFFTTSFGLDLALTLGEASLVAEVDAEAAQLMFRGLSDVSPFAGTIIGDFTPSSSMDISGYAFAALQWGISYETTFEWWPDGPGTRGLLVMRVHEDEAELSIATVVDLGSLEFVPGVDLDFGETAITFALDFATGDLCGETGYEGSDFECKVEVCVGATGFDFAPDCKLPSGFLCFADGMCSSDACEGIVPDEACEAVCGSSRDVCEGTCATTGGACSLACDGVEEGCSAGCTVADGACTVARESCNALCEVEYGLCETANLACGVITTCQDCGGKRSSCKDSCSGTFNGCASGCSAPCVAAGDSCRSGCTSIEDACSDDCDDVHSGCMSGCEPVGTCD